MNEGKLLVTANHVRDVKDFRQYGKSHLIKSKVIRQTSISLSPYDTNLHINEERFVEDVSCTCVYNKSKKCKHIAALVYIINHEESITKTSHEQQWGNQTPVPVSLLRKSTQNAETAMKCFLAKK
ncbi:hypothetical protein PV325_004597 [Microctonus aethiopoides]|uniref:SWIM-type domain-containing protein n=1 Tax=Microctonus aethiopoides TaxID=144406 RepID=A0AA39FHT2_9HYME|nr:hypothetical protein PV325_004597 [Microctonus aethiopoides]KAK0169753.1 hypothetical protein PV328_010395 [Microctonus aethiopoides]